MIEKIAALGEPSLWTIFLVCALLMAIFPFWKQIKKAIRIKFSNQKAAIHDFSWRIAPDHYLFMVKDNEYYLQSSGKQFILEGGAIILSWHVTGAYRVDIHPLGDNIKGNTAVIAAKKERNRFMLTAYTLEGKLTKELELNPALFRTLDTFNLSQELHFKQKNHKLRTNALSEKPWMHGKYKRGKMQPLATINTHNIQHKNTRYYFTNLLERLRFFNPNINVKYSVITYIFSDKIVKTLRSNNAKYNQALNSQQEPL